MSFPDEETLVWAKKKYGGSGGPAGEVDLTKLGLVEETIVKSVTGDGVSFTDDSHMDVVGKNGCLANMGTVVELTPGETYQITLTSQYASMDVWDFTVVAQSASFMGMDAVVIGNYYLFSGDDKDDTGEPFLFATSASNGVCALVFLDEFYNSMDWTVGILHHKKVLAFDIIYYKYGDKLYTIEIDEGRLVASEVAGD